MFWFVLLSALVVHATMKGDDDAEVQSTGARPQPADGSKRGGRNNGNARNATDGISEEGGSNEGEGIEYELADYLLLSDIDSLHSHGSWQSAGSSQFDDESTVESSVADSTSTGSSTGASSSKYSVYHDFDALFIGVSEHAGDLSIHDSWTEAEEGWEHDRRGRRAPRSKVAPANTTPSVELINNDGGIGMEDNALILKNLVIKCLVRNNHKKGGKEVTKESVEDSEIAVRLPKDPSMTSVNSESRGEEDLIRLPRDPSASKESSRNDQEATKEEEKESRNEEGSGAAKTGARDPPERDPAEVALIMQLQTRDGRMQYYRNLAKGGEGGSVGPPRPDVVRYGAVPPTSSGAMSVSSRQTWHPRGQHAPAAGATQPPRPDVPRQIAPSTVSHIIPSTPTEFSNPYSTLGRTYSQYSAYDAYGRDLAAVRSRCLAGQFAGQSMMRRRRYKEMLMRQRGMGGVGGGASVAGIGSAAR